MKERDECDPERKHPADKEDGEGPSGGERKEDCKFRQGGGGRPWGEGGFLAKT